MMKQALLVVALGSCAFAQKHQGLTIGLVTGTVGFGLCGLNVEKLGVCSAIGAGVGVTLGGITGLVTLLADTNAEPVPDEQVVPIGTANDAPPGLPVDAGVPPIDATRPSDAASDAPSDAAAPSDAS